MLKLEKGSRLSGLMMRMRERERFFEPRLLKALMIALIFHIGGFLLFHVSPFSLPSSFVFPPIEVQSESIQPRVSALASTTPEENEEFSPPPLTLIPIMDWISLPKESALLPTLAFNFEVLQPLEQRVWPKWHEPLSIPLEEPHIQLVISGDLAKHTLVEMDPLLNEMQPQINSRDPPTLESESNQSPKERFVTYQVLMDEKTGELFWYERVESSGVVALDRLTEKILLNLHFVPAYSTELVTGALNFVILNETN